jgi:hypothetical protein
MRLPTFDRVYGVDFSGARLAGRAIWVAEIVPRPARRRSASPPFTLTSLHRLDTLCGTPDRAPVLRHLVGMIAGSTAALWGFDFPFGLPVELFPDGTPWADQFAFLAGWADEAYACGLECVRRARVRHRRLHIRRQTDTDARAPFDTFYYRMIYQA